MPQAYQQGMRDHDASLSWPEGCYAHALGDDKSCETTSAEGVLDACGTRTRTVKVSFGGK